MASWVGKKNDVDFYATGAQSEICVKIVACMASDMYNLVAKVSSITFQLRNYGDFSVQALII